jgi:two-component system aerobic respiration control sensor histidine kinase ArcB
MENRQSNFSLLSFPHLNSKVKELAFETLFDRFPVTFFWMDRAGKMLGCNEEELKLLKLSHEQFVGKHSLELFNEEAWFNSQEVMETKKNLVKEETHINGDCSQILFLSIKSPIFDDSEKVIGLLGISLDITERKKQEEALLIAKKAEAANKIATSFITNMRSDLHTPLSGIMNFAQLVRDEVQDARIAEYADNMFASSKALLDFVNEILEVINITSGDLPLLKKKFDAIDKTESIIALLKAKANAKNIALNFTVDKKLPRYWVGDFKRFNRIALELMANALNFTHEGKVDVTLELAKQKENNGVIKLTVKDTGIGIPQNKQEEIFLRFSRLRPSFEGIYKGAGLGLTIAKQFLDELHGEIYVDSEVNKGSTFTVLVPMNIALLQDDSSIDKTQDNVIFFNEKRTITKKEKNEVCIS